METYMLFGCLSLLAVAVTDEGLRGPERFEFKVYAAICLITSLLGATGLFLVLIGLLSGTKEDNLVFTVTVER